MILIIDNFDSFTYNLAQYFGVLGEDIDVRRNNAIDIKSIERLSPTHIVISPGPSTPDNAGVSLDVIHHFAGKIPILGVCLGHQAIAQAMGAKVVRARHPIHGKTSIIKHTNRGVFRNIPSPMSVTRYHSLLVDKRTLPDSFELTAWTEDENGKIDEIMAIKHRNFALEGVQFHPESILSEHGLSLLANFIK
ncbi:anthranilate synthase component II [Thorsellia anophelis]|uniref:Anthranilate synthase component 2 n=1 Tax=Thorsellia anophelis DSM 18579 TaxID=1123402 RepID=A0A1I0A0F3_9GAMM|nr:aminodeoxychorismate/anthranilate synthase component II [Thorsellia anophelis]SES87124.1 anthranilate synthase component 2 [Thorsellia anophelis DSM 18579]